MPHSHLREKLAHQLLWAWCTTVSQPKTWPQERPGASENGCVVLITEAIAEREGQIHKCLKIRHPKKKKKESQTILVFFQHCLLHLLQHTIFGMVVSVGEPLSDKSSCRSSKPPGSLRQLLFRPTLRYDTKFSLSRAAY